MFREDEMNEFKKTTSEINEAMISISGMLNKHGHGKIYFGLKNDGTPNKFTIVDSTIRDVSRKIFEAIRPQIFPEIKTEFIDDVEIIEVIFEGKDKPYSAFGKYYKRVADEDREMSPGELRSMMIDQEYEENWENKSSLETIEDVDDKTRNNFYKNATACGRLPKFETDNQGLMQKLGLLNGNHLTNAGRMLFSKHQPIILKMAVFATEHKNTFLDISRVEGNIFELIEAATSYIIKNIRWSSNIGEDGIYRVETPEIPIEFSRIDRNNLSENTIKNDTINGTITELENEVLEILRKDGNTTIAQMVEICGKSARTVTRAISSLKSKQLIERNGSNKTGNWKVNQ